VNAVEENESQSRDEVPRIVALPKRPVLDCERERGTRRWSPEAQALIDVMTEKFSRGPRLSCGCRDRTVTATAGGGLIVFHQGRLDEPPPAPLFTTVDAFCADNAHNKTTVDTVRALKPSYSVALPGLGYPVCLTELNPVQAWTLRELPKTRGIFGLISVGFGKTLLGLLAPLAVPGARTVVILAKPNQRLHYRNAYLRLREHFSVSSFVLDRTDIEGASFIVPGTPVLHFVPYSLISNPKSTDLLKRLNPDAIIADEVHSIAARTARTMRFLNYMSTRKDVVFAGWSGSTVKRSIKDVSHLVAHALGLGSPYPIWPSEVDKWAAVIDPVPLPDTSSDTALSLKKAFDKNANKVTGIFTSMRNDGIREGFRERIITTPGVISTRSSAATASLSLKLREPPKMPEAVKKALLDVRIDEIRPDGEVLVENIDIIMCARSVASGFYEYWAYPKGESEELIDAWFAARKLFSKALRRKILLGETHLDSPMLCANAAERAWRTPKYTGTLPTWLEESWPEWARLKELVQPDPRVRWIDDYLARDAAKWATEGKEKGVVWCQSRALGLKIAELTGLPYHAGGPKGEEKILAEKGDRSIIASIDAYGTGLDGLQYKFYRQLVTEPPSSGDRWEQLLGRLVRIGQPEDTVETEVYAHTHEVKDALRKAFMLAEFIEATTPNQQLLLSADCEFDL
jgi:hypothetical protein